MFHIREVLKVFLGFLDISLQVSVVLLAVFMIVMPVFLEFYTDVYLDFKSKQCLEYSNITNKHIKYFNAVGCFEKINDNWVKTNL
jgi:hypothetical protein